MTADLATIAATPAETNIIAQHFATRITGIDLINGALIHTIATVGDDGFINVEVTQSPPGFVGPDYKAKVLIHVAHPVPIPTTIELTDPETQGAV